MSDKIEAASVLAFERKLDPSDALLFAGKWDDRKNSENWSPISIREKAVRGTISNRLSTKDSDPAKLDAKVENPNLQRVDVATLPNDCDTLKITFTLRVLGGVGAPSVCNKIDFRNKLRDVVKEYVGEYKFTELSHRYAYNLANGRFLWRNRIGAESVAVDIHHVVQGKSEKKFSFDAFQFALRNFEFNDVDEQNEKDQKELAELIKEALQGSKHLLLSVDAFVRIGAGQEVFPSQELILDSSTGTKKGKKSKVLYQVDNIAAMHSQKIGNAIRTVDNWYESDEKQKLGPIAVEPYGAVTTLGKAYRVPKEKKDFYTLFDNWILRDKMPKEVGDQHFVMATLIRGGVFGASAKNKKEK